MNAARVAQALAAHGFAPTSVIEGTLEVDGEVEFSPTVHVQVATDGSYACVVTEVEDGFVIGVERRCADVAGLAADLRAAGVAA